MTLIRSRQRYALFVMADRELTDLLGEFLVQMQELRPVAPSTLRAYGADLRDFLAWLSERRQGDLLSEITRLDCRRYLVELEERRRKATTIQRKLASLRAFTRFLQEKGHQSSDSARLIRGPKIPKRVPRFLSTVEVEALLGQEFGTGFPGPRDRAVLEVLYSTGARVAEAARLKMGDLDLTDGTARLFGKGRRERLALLGRQAQEAIADWLPVRSQLLKDRR